LNEAFFLVVFVKTKLYVTFCKHLHMEANHKIKSAIERVSAALTQRPAFGMGTGISRASIKDGLTCEIREGSYTFIADMPEQVGGKAAGPTPGVFGRAALGSCLAIGYMMKAATMDIPIAALEVEIQADYNDGALFGTALHVPPGYLQIRYTVTIDSPAHEDKIIEMLDEADKHSPYLDIFTRSQTCHRKVNFITEIPH
jgi:uncharacterized OsmC-like protein